MTTITSLDRAECVLFFLFLFDLVVQLYTYRFSPQAKFMVQAEMQASLEKIAKQVSSLWNIHLIIFSNTRHQEVQ